MDNRTMNGGDGHGEGHSCDPSVDPSPLLEDPESTEDLLVNCRFRYYTLPLLRYATVIKLLLSVDAVFSLVLWLAGGNGQYFVDNISHFHLTQSVFDLAVLASVHCVVLVALYTSLEDVTLEGINHPYEVRLIRKKALLHAGIILISVIYFVYPLIKGSFIIHAMQTDETYTSMHLTYNILAIGGVVFGFLELVAALYSFRAMHKVKVMRILHRLDENLQELDEQGQPIKKNVNLRRLVGLARPEACLLCLATVCLLMSTAAQTAAPLFFGQVVDAALKSMSDLNQTVIILVVVYTIGSIASMCRSAMFTVAGQRLVARLRKDLFENIILQDIAFFDTTRTGELTNRLASDTQVIQNAVTVNISMLVRYLLQILGSLALMFVLNASLTGVLLAVVPVVSLGAVQYGKLVRKLRQDFQDRLADASTTAEESISSIRTVRSFTGEGKTTETYGRDIDKSYAVGKKLAYAQGGFEGVIGMVSYGAISLVLWYGGKLVHDGDLTPGVLASFLLYTLQVALAFGFISALYGDFMQAVGASVRIFDLLDRHPDVAVKGGLTMAQPSGSIEFQHVKFTYPSRPDTQVLKDISFTISPGHMVALVGPSGGGKSTIVSLIERFYDPDAGSILLGGMDLKALDPQWFRTKVSMVGQEPTLFACSIKDNIAYGRDATMEEIEAAAKQANAHDFIMDFKDKYDTLVGERGVRLSGGQKQRVAIARALIMDPLVLLLDEATSALDAESEHLVQEAIDRAMQNRTVLVIAHRLSTVRNAQKVVVIDKGCVGEQGTHDQLIAKKGIYKRLVLHQLMAAESTDKYEHSDNVQHTQNTDALLGTDKTERTEGTNIINTVEADMPSATFTVGTAED